MSLPAPNPQRPREHPVDRRTRPALHDGAIPQAPQAPPVPPAAQAAAASAEPAAPPAATGGEPEQPTLIRIPYREWKGPRPRTVSIAASVIVLAGIISLIGGIAAARAPVPPLSSALVQLERLGLDIAGYTAVFQALALAISIVVSGFYLLFAYLLRDGRNWARIGGAVLAGPALAAALVHGDVPQVFAVLSATAGLALSYRRDCSTYFRPRQSQYRSVTNA